MPRVSAVRCWVSGRVQGVFYRSSTATRAHELGLVGSATNLTDGRVEIVAIGKREQIASLCEWLWEGPSAARVSRVEIEDLDPAELDPIPGRFETG